jgi:response regulator PhyR-like protein
MTMRPSVRDAMLAAIPNLRAFATLLCGNVDRGDDLVEETLRRAIADIDSFQPGSNMSAWLFKMLHNLFRPEYRGQRRKVEDIDGSYAENRESHPEHSRVEFEGFRVVLSELPAGQREALIRRLALFLRGGGGHLRVRGRNDQEPGQPRTNAALEALVGWERVIQLHLRMLSPVTGRRSKRCPWQFVNPRKNVVAVL